MPLPPAPVDAFRSWAAGRWKDATDATIGRVQSGLWDVQATQAIDALGQQMARMREEQEQAQEQERQRQEAVRAQLEEGTRRQEEEAAQRRAALSSTAGGILGGIGERVGAGFSALGSAAQRGVGGLQTTGTDWASRAEDAIGGLGAALPGGAGWDADLARIRGEREAIEQQYPTPEPTGPAGFTLPQTGTPEGERITSQLAETAMRETPGGQTVLAATRAMAPQGPMTADTPGTNLLGIGQAAMTPWNVTQGVARGVTQAVPGGETSVFEGQPIPRWVPGVGGQRLTAETPVLGGLTTPDEALPFAVGIAGGTPREAMDALTLATRPVTALAQGVPYVYGRTGDVVRQVGGRVGGAARAELGTAERVVPPSVVAGLPYDVRLPTDPADLRVLTQSNGIRLTPEGVEVDLERYQKPLQAGQPVSRESVFYSPAGGRGPSYRHTEPDAPEGGSQGIRGLTVFKRPLVVERSGEGYGHALPALRKLYPGSAGQRRANDVQGAIDTVVRRLGTGVFPGQRPIVRDEMAALLVKHGGFDAADAGRVADDVLAFTPPGQEGMARYPLADAIGVNRARQHGYDGILYARGGHIQEAIDVREAVYPGPRGEFATRELGPHFQAGDPSRVGGTPALAPRHLEALRALHDDAVAGEAAGQQATDDAIARLRAAKADFAARNPPDPVTGRLRPNFHVLQDAEPAVGDAQAAWQRAVADQRGAALVRSGLRRVLDNPAGADEVRQGETFLRDALAEGQARLDEAARLSDEANDAYVDILRGLPTPRQGPEPPELPQAREAMRLARNAHTEAQQRVIGLERAVAEPFGGAGGQALTDARAEHQRVAAETRAIADALNPVQDAQMAAGDAWDNGLMAFQRSNRGAGPEDFAATPGGRQLAEAFREAEARLTTAQDAWMQAERRLTAAEAALQALEQSAGGRHVTEAVTESGFHVLDLHAPLADPAQHRRLVEAVPPDARQGFLAEAQANAKHQGGLTGQGATVAIQAGLRTAGYDPTTLSVYDVLYASGVDALTTRNGAVKPLSEMTDGDRAASVVKVEAAGGAASRAPGEPPPTGSSVRTGTGTLTAQTAAPSTQSTPGGAAALLPGGEASRPGLLGIARAAVEPLGARGALTGGERAVDVAAGTAGGVAGAATAEEDATWQERAARGALGASLGGLAGANVRQLGRVGQRALGDQTLGAVSGGQLALPGVGKTPRSRDLLGDVTTVGTGLGLANPASLAANLTGGLMRSATRVARELAGETGNPLHAFEDVVGMAVEVPRALARLPRSIWEGPTPRARALVGASIGSGLENRRNVPALVGTIGTRANAATDQLIRAINEAGASRVARARGRTGVERAQDVQRAGEFATYQLGRSSPLADLMSQSRSWLSDPQASTAQRLAGGVLYGFAPYVRMPERLLVESLKTITDPVTQALPLVQALRKGDKAAMREARARIAVGGAASALFYSLWRDGGLTGDAPTDPTERRRREAEGAQWNTVRIGDATIPLRYLGDLGQSASAIASTLDGAKAAMDAGKDPGQVFEAGANEALRWVLSESYLRDLARFGGDVLEGRGANTLERIAAGTVTRPAAALAPLAAADPYEREAEGFVGQAMARVPGLRQRLPERIDPLTGEPQRRVGTGASRALGQYGSDLTPEGRELARLKVNPRTFGPTEQYAGALQTPAQRRALQRAYGSESGKAVRDTLASEAYQKADDAGKKRQLEKALRDAAADADVVAGGNVARGPKEQAEYEYLAVPQFEGVRGSADEVRRQNLAIRRARALRSEYRGRYPNDPDRGEGEFYREHRKEYALAQRPAIPPEELRRRRQQIEDNLGGAGP